MDNITPKQNERKKILQEKLNDTLRKHALPKVYTKICHVNVQWGLCNPHNNPDASPSRPYFGET